MFDNQNFQRLVEAGNLTGEVVATNNFIIEVKGLEGVRIGAQVLFEDGQRGMVREARGDHVILFNVDSETMSPGTLAVLEHDVLQIPVGEKLIGRVITPLGEPLDGKGPITASGSSGAFNPAPGIMDRAALKDQVTSGVSFVDSFFPVVFGQRIAILGDAKSGKSTFLSQLSASQVGSETLVVYVLIGKRKVDVELLLAGLRKSGAMKNTLVVMANIFDSLTQSYLAPYAACAMAEYLWHTGKDVIIIYDDLTSHAEAYRQLSLLQEVDPGRDSYPGDIFYAHSSLLERAGKLLEGGKTLTALPVVVTPNDDITAYLSTSIMSITDGQIIFDLQSFRQGVRPAVKAGLSVSRVGGQSQTKRAKRLSGTLFKTLAKFHQAEEFSHFGSSLSADATIDLKLGKTLYTALKQPPEELFTLHEQELMLETIMKGAGKVDINVVELKKSVKTVSSQVKEEADFDRLEAELLEKHTYKTSTEPAVDEKNKDASAPPAEGDDKEEVKSEDKPGTDAKPAAETKSDAEAKKEPAHA